MYRGSGSRMRREKKTTMEMPDVTVLLDNWSKGDQNALDQLTPVVYDDLGLVARR